VLVDIYYNYEVIPDPTVVPILQPGVDNAFEEKDQTELHSAIKGILKGGSLIHPIKKFNWADALEQVTTLGIKYLPKILALM